MHLIIIDAHVNYRPPLPSQITDEHCEKWFNVPKATSCKTPGAMNIREGMLKEVKYNLVLYTKHLVARRYEGRVLFIKASDDISKFEGDLYNGFKEVMSEIRVVVADGRHSELLSEEQSVRQIACAVEEFVQG